MKKHLCITLFLTFLAAGVNAQQTDSVAWLISRYDYQQALSLLDQLDPAGKQPELLYLRGMAFLYQGKLPEAQADFAEVAKLRPQWILHKGPTALSCPGALTP